MQLIAGAGITCVETVSAASADAAVTAAATLGYPVVLKTDAPDITHRARVGGVKLGLGDEAAVRTAYDELLSLGPDVVVQPHLQGSAEYALGVIGDHLLGPLVLVAHGGSRIEELASRVVGLPEAVLSDPDRLVGQLPGVLEEARAPLAQAVSAVAQLALGYGAGLAALDLNPLILIGDRLIAVDALVEAQVV